ncbi:MAG: hypothetical protein KGL10_06405 [Alphaproteobacteria bacterium]|nr:hypothetical protein [Alphaproteobacteria bacterium]MDE2336925.1 hypothetical protein [Alphaproteobacteria bacterium]
MFKKYLKSVYAKGYNLMSFATRPDGAITAARVAGDVTGLFGGTVLSAVGLAAMVTSPFLLLAGIGLAVSAATLPLAAGLAVAGVVCAAGGAAAGALGLGMTDAAYHRWGMTSIGEDMLSLPRDVRNSVSWTARKLRPLFKKAHDRVTPVHNAPRPDNTQNAGKLEL